MISVISTPPGISIHSGAVAARHERRRPPRRPPVGPAGRGGHRGRRGPPRQGALALLMAAHVLLRLVERPDCAVF